MTTLRSGVLLATLIGPSLTVGQVSPAPPPPYVEIRLPVNVRSEQIFGRYTLDGNFGGWIQPRAGVPSYLISTYRQGVPASRLRGILYAPGCALQTLDLPVSDQEVHYYLFRCTPLPAITLRGQLTRIDRLYGHKIGVQANYVARWAGSFLGIGEDFPTEIPLDVTKSVSADANFQISLPDFSQDPIASGANPGEFRVVARDVTTGRQVAILEPRDPALRTNRMGGLQIRNGYSSAIVFAPCTLGGVQPHDAIGFALRPGSDDACDR